MWFARAAWAALIVNILGLGLRDRLPLDSTWSFSLARLRVAVDDALPWFGAIFAGSYAAFYTRFQAQYSYLANLYNQVMGSSGAEPPGPEETYAAWWAGYIEDAEELHLDTKPVFASVIASVLERPLVREKYGKHTPGGEERLKNVEQRVSSGTRQGR